MICVGYMITGFNSGSTHASWYAFECKTVMHQDVVRSEKKDDIINYMILIGVANVDLHEYMIFL